MEDKQDYYLFTSTDLLFRYVESIDFEMTLGFASGLSVFKSICNNNENYNKLKEAVTWDQLEERILWLAQVPHDSKYGHPYDHAIAAYLLIYKDKGYNNASIMKDLISWFDISHDFFWVRFIDVDAPQKVKLDLSNFVAKNKEI